MLARYGNTLLLYGNPDLVRAAIDRIDRGEEAGDRAAVGDDKAYGDAYGVIPIERIARVIGERYPELGAKLRASIDRVELHAAAEDDILVVLDLVGAAGRELGELRRALQTAIDAMRAAGDAPPADPFSSSVRTLRLVPTARGLRLEAVVPLEIVQQQLAWCAKPEARAAR